MKRQLFVVLMMICSVSWARWEISGKTDDGITTHYHDTSTIRKNGAVAKMWTIQDYLFVQKDEIGKFKSIKTLFMFHCKEEKLAVMAGGCVFRFNGNW